MSEISKFQAYKKKLYGVCNENNLVFRFRQKEYPTTLTILPCSGVEEQMDFLSDPSDTSNTSPDARLVFYYKDGELLYKISDTFIITDALFAKLKNLYKNMVFYWNMYFFRNVIERHAIEEGAMPVIDEDDADDAPELPPQAEPLEEDVEEPEAGCDASEEMIAQAAEVVRMENKATLVLLQRRLNVGYATAQVIMDELEKRGVVGTYNGGAREVLPTDEPEE